MVAVYVPSTVSMLLATQRYIFGSYPVSVVSGALAVTFVALVMLDQLARAWESSEYSERLTSTIADLGATEHRLRMLLDDMPQAVLVTDATGRILQVNSVTAQMMGRPADELIGSSVASLAPPEYTDFITQMWQQMHHGDLDIRLPRMRLPLAPPADPSVVVEVDAILPIRDRDNVVISLRDISSSVREAEAHRQTRERFGRAFRGAPTGMALSTSNDGRSLVNPGAIPSSSKTFCRKLNFDFFPRPKKRFAPASKVNPLWANEPQQPPGRSPCSSTSTSRPRRARSAAAERPPIPPPITMTPYLPLNPVRSCDRLDICCPFL